MKKNFWLIKNHFICMKHLFVYRLQAILVQFSRFRKCSTWKTILYAKKHNIDYWSEKRINFWSFIEFGRKYAFWVIDERITRRRHNSKPMLLWLMGCPIWVGIQASWVSRRCELLLASRGCLHGIFRMPHRSHASSSYVLAECSPSTWCLEKLILLLDHELFQPFFSAKLLV